jgi:demethylmenaquinone methyltransferase/2-methoxy-6-polyprenyl-1,4-benzoquinol methylase
MSQEEQTGTATFAQQSYADQLRLAGRLTRPAICQAIQELALPPDSRGLDAGCGVGQHAVWLAEAIGETGRVTGIDLSAENIAVARVLVGESRQANQIELMRGNLLGLPFEDDSFDWAWCADVLWPVPGFDPVAALAELVRVVRPGGGVAILFWSSQRLLPGHPTLEARLDAAHAESNPYLGYTRPELHCLRARGWFSSLGLASCRAKSFLAEASAPLAPELRNAVAYCFSMFWGDLEGSVAREDWSTYQRLCTPGSADFLLDRPDYYCFLTYTLFHARLP